MDINAKKSAPLFALHAEDCVKPGADIIAYAESNAVNLVVCAGKY